MAAWWIGDRAPTALTRCFEAAMLKAPSGVRIPAPRQRDLDIDWSIPTLFNGEVYLCKARRAGDQFWHGIEGGFRGRGIIDQFSPEPTAAISCNNVSRRKRNRNQARCRRQGGARPASRAGFTSRKRLFESTPYFRYPIPCCASQPPAAIREAGKKATSPTRARRVRARTSRRARLQCRPGKPRRHFHRHRFPAPCSAMKYRRSSRGISSRRRGHVEIRLGLPRAQAPAMDRPRAPARIQQARLHHRQLRPPLLPLVRAAGATPDTHGVSCPLVLTI